MQYFRAWYVPKREAPSVDERYPEWVVFATDEDEARAKVLATFARTEPEHGFVVALLPFEDEESGVIAFAAASQEDQAIS